MFLSKREISRSNRRTGDNLSKPESPVQNRRVGMYAPDEMSHVQVFKNRTKEIQ